MALTFTPPNNRVIKQPSEKKETKYVITTVFPTSIELDELSIPGEKSNQNQRPEDVVGLEYPLIKINEYIFSRDEIRSVTIDCTEFLPRITLNVGLLNQLFLAKEMPKDGDIISLAIRNRVDILKIIRNDYVITGVHTQPNLTEVKSPVLITFYGELFVPGLKSEKNNSSFEGTSYEALQNFAKKYKLGFASNENNTNDKQIWINANNFSGDNYINDISERAWSDDLSFYKCWIDLYYNLNFVNINKQLMSAESEVDMAALISNVDKNWNYGADTDENKTINTVKVFSNFPNFKTSPFFITSWRPLNRSSSITFQVGTKVICEMFEHNKNLYEDSQKQKHWSVPIEPTYDPEKINKYILLRGRATYVQNKENTELKRANYSYVDLYQKFPWVGIQYTISNPNEDNSKWDGNHHKNYNIARVKNIVNNKELDKLNIHIEVIGNNFNIIIGDKVPLALIRTDAVENIQINLESGFMDALDLFYSGWYLVKGFKLNWTSSNEGSILSNFTQEFILTRREWPPPIAVDPIKIVEENK